MNTKKLRDMNLHAVADELEQLRKFKAEVEGQEPLFKAKEITTFPLTGSCTFAKTKYIQSEEGFPVYAKPVPADKPVTRQDVIDVLLSTRGQSEGVTADAILGLLSDKGTVPADKPAVAVPDGWKLVPIDPTGEMANAAMNAEDESIRTMGHSVPFLDLWHAMLEAAPSHSQQSAAPEHACELNTAYDGSCLICETDSEETR